jgi:hypothetical protein
MPCLAAGPPSASGVKLLSYAQEVWRVRSLDLKARSTLLVALIAVAIVCCAWIAPVAEAAMGGAVTSTSLAGSWKPGATPTGGDPDIGQNGKTTPPPSSVLRRMDAGSPLSLPIRLRWLMVVIAARYPGVVR